MVIDYEFCGYNYRAFDLVRERVGGERREREEEGERGEKRERERE